MSKFLIEKLHEQVPPLSNGVILSKRPTFVEEKGRRDSKKDAVRSTSRGIKIFNSCVDLPVHVFGKENFKITGRRKAASQSGQVLFMKILKIFESPF